MSDLVALLVAVVLVAAFIYVATAVFTVVLLVGGVYFLWLGIITLVRMCRRNA